MWVFFACVCMWIVFVFEVLTLLVGLGWWVRVVTITRCLVRLTLTSAHIMPCSPPIHHAPASPGMVAHPTPRPFIPQTNKHASLATVRRAFPPFFPCALPPHTPPQVLVATSTLAWGVNTPAHLVIIKGTEYYDAPQRRYVDFPITDVLQVCAECVCVCACMFGAPACFGFCFGCYKRCLSPANLHATLLLLLPVSCPRHSLTYISLR